MGEFRHRIQQKSSNPRLEVILRQDKGIFLRSLSSCLHQGWTDPRNFKQNAQEIPDLFGKEKGRGVYTFEVIENG